MLRLFSALKYINGYWRYAFLNIFFNIIQSVLSVFSIALVIPFLKLLFEKGSSEYVSILSKGIPHFSLSIDYFMGYFDFTMAFYIVTYGKVYALTFICTAVIIMTVIKNFSRYMAMYFLAPIRNGVVRDLRNKIFSKSLDLPLSYYSNERKGDIISRMTSDVQEIEWSIMQTLELIFREPIVIIFSLV
ncbi:MAG TPA: ABC transporter transmembrane domain-containing protein, partial [Bacteroidia bacterium]|nr:ABC transporter transmembrane domain-containing protein [Bacteroidia bacterium]